MDLTPYTHIQLAFGHVSSSYAIGVSHIQVRFSAKLATYHIFRDEVKPGNQDAFVANVVSFVTEHDPDGVDIDWKYLNTPDIPGILAGDMRIGTAKDAENYHAFLTKLRAAMPSNKFVSFCAPASKIAVGVTSYSRLFQITTPGCTGPMCTYTSGGIYMYPPPSIWDSIDYRWTGSGQV
ncbi:glycoside hydrolase superfamily [Aspergillus pseudoustus]|uniref:Glycoside hydrolase superfamily n=1 Tax=Aspergillus pseudoustus TaxID=1810923 RepID=A0ABR4KM04_9EURO